MLFCGVVIVVFSSLCCCMWVCLVIRFNVVVVFICGIGLDFS